MKRLLSWMAWSFIRQFGTPSLYHFIPERAVQTKILGELGPPPVTLFSRSVWQYQSQSRLLETKRRLVLNLVSALAFPFLILFSVFMRVRKGAHFSQKSAVYFEPTLEMLPNSLLSGYQISLSTSELALTKEDLKFLYRLFCEAPFSPYFLFKNAFKIAHYRAQVLRCQPRALICASEYSFTSSCLTEWCRAQDIQHINVMHGEKFFHIQDAGATFDRIYVWDQHYARLFHDLHISATEWHTEVPKSFADLKAGSVISQKKKENLVLKMYLQIPDKKKWAHLASFLKLLLPEYHVIVRPHPRWRESKLLRQCFENFQIEDSATHPFHASLSEADGVISGFSTVLFQAHLLGKKVIIDDLSDPLLFARLKELDFLPLRRPHVLMSHLTKTQTESVDL